MVNINEERLLDSLLELVSIPGQSREEGAVAKHLLPILSKLGFSVKVDEADRRIGGNAGNIIARLDPSEGRSEWIALLSHMDTVSLRSRTVPVVRNGVVYSQGNTILGADDRAGIAAILEAVRTLLESGRAHPGVEVVFTVCEECGLLGSKALEIDDLRASMAFVVDSSCDPGYIITTAPFQKKIDWRILGRAAHAGVRPEEGISAIEAAARGIAKMKLGRLDAETTANVGIVSGGEATNIVCDLMEVRAEARSLSPEKLDAQVALMTNAMRTEVEAFGASLEENVYQPYCGYDLTVEDDVVRRAIEGVERCGLTPVLAPTGGGSDANILNSRGLPTVNLGMGLRNGHSSEEHIAIANLVRAAMIVHEIVAD